MRFPRMPGFIRKSLAVASLHAHRLMRRVHPAKLILAGYLTYMLLGWAALNLPWSQANSVAPLDNLFIAVSAVSTTGLVTVDPGSSYTFLGELVILLLIQAGGIGYMTLGSFAMLAVAHHLTPLRDRITRAAFTLPDNVSTSNFISLVVIFTLIVEAIGAAFLYGFFLDAGVADAAWSAIFHSVSAFCTAGFSLNANSFESFRGHLGINSIISILSILGAMGFLIVWDLWRSLTIRAFSLSFTSKVILKMTLAFLLVGTGIIFVAEPGMASLPAGERLLASFFQTMTATTTVGFNTHPIGSLTPAILVVMYFLMAIGASPSGTGGGLKTTTFAAMLGLVRSMLRRRPEITFFGRMIAPARLHVAMASSAYFVMLLVPAVFVLCLVETEARFESILFEAISAIGTVGLSMGLTGTLSDVGKFVIILLMVAGRVGILTFGMAIASRDETPESVKDEDLLV